MTDPRSLELIHAELDGELSAAQREELHSRLANDPEARRQREQLGRMAAALGRMAPLAPPADLQQRVLRAGPPAAPQITFRQRREQWVRTALTLAAGMIIAVVGIGFVGHSRPDFDPEQLVATMGQQASSPAPASAVIGVQAADLRGSVELSRAGEHWLLVFDLDSRQPVTVSAAYPDAAFRLTGYAQGDSGVASFAATPGRISFVNQGPQRLALFLQPEAGGPVRLRFEGDGKRLQEALIAVPASGQGK